MINIKITPILKILHVAACMGY